MSPRLPRITAEDLLRALRRAGWQEDRQRGSHIRLWHPERKGLVTVAYHRGQIIKPKVLESVLEQAGLSADDLRSLL
jgi:predicted RNA binding protein YcfA (HicA-like mRNA interferase family)